MPILRTFPDLQPENQTHVDSMVSGDPVFFSSVKLYEK